MMWSLPIAVLLVSVASLSSEQHATEVDIEIQTSETDVTDTVVTETTDSADEISETPKGDVADAQHDGGHRRTESDAVTPTGRETFDANDVSIETSSPSEESEKPLTLDELLRQVRKTPHLQREAMIVRLVERRRLALAVRSTLEAAEQVADFGLAGTQLLNDASLDQVVATMIDGQETETAVLTDMSVDTSSTQPVASHPIPDASDSLADGNEEPGIEDWHPVYIVKDVRGHRIGWRNGSNDERAIVYVGEEWHIGPDTVVVVAVANDGDGRYLVMEVNGKRREVHLF